MRFLLFFFLIISTNSTFSQSGKDLQLKAQRAYESGQYDQSISIGLKAKTEAEKNPANLSRLFYGRILTYLGLSYQAKRDYEKSLIYHKESARIASKHYGEKHYLYGTRMVNVGIVLRYLDNYGDAQAALEKGLPVVAQHWGKSNDIYRNGIIHCAKACMDNEDIKRGEYWYLEAEKVYASQKKTFPASASIDLANLYYSQNRYEEVIDYLEKSLLDISSKSKHIDAIIDIMNALSLYYSEQKDYDKLLKIYRICDKRKVAGRIIFLEDYFATSLKDFTFTEDENTFKLWEEYSGLYEISEYGRPHELTKNFSRMFLKYDTSQLEKVFEITNFGGDSIVIMARLEMQGDLAIMKEDFDLAAQYFREVLAYKADYFSKEELTWRSLTNVLNLKLKTQSTLRKSEDFEDSFEMLTEIILEIMNEDNRSNANFFFKENLTTEFSVLEEFDEWQMDEILWTIARKELKSKAKHHKEELSLFADYLAHFKYSAAGSKLKREIR